MCVSIGIAAHDLSDMPAPVDAKSKTGNRIRKLLQYTPNTDPPTTTHVATYPTSDLKTPAPTLASPTALLDTDNESQNVFQAYQPTANLTALSASMDVDDSDAKLESGDNDGIGFSFSPTTPTTAPTHESRLQRMFGHNTLYPTHTHHPTAPHPPTAPHALPEWMRTPPTTSPTAPTAPTKPFPTATPTPVPPTAPSPHPLWQLVDPRLQVLSSSNVEDNEEPSNELPGTQAASLDLPGLGLPRVPVQLDVDKDDVASRMKKMNHTEWTQVLMWTTMVVVGTLLLYFLLKRWRHEASAACKSDDLTNRALVPLAYTKQKHYGSFLKSSEEAEATLSKALRVC